MTNKERANKLEADLDLWQESQRRALESGDTDTARKCADSIHKLTNAIVKLRRDECEALLAKLEEAERRRGAEAAAEADLDAFAEQMRHTSKH